MSTRPSLPSQSVLQYLLSFTGAQMHDGCAHVSVFSSAIDSLPSFPSAFVANCTQSRAVSPSLGPAGNCLVSRSGFLVACLDLVDDLLSVWNALGYGIELRALTFGIDGPDQGHDFILHRVADARFVAV
jgi:hypothetical protein